MPQVVQFTSPRQVELVPADVQPLLPGHVRVRTYYSGISAGTELTAYRGSNPYLTKSWDPVLRVFVDGPPTFAYPVVGWGYSEVGEVVELADDLDAEAYRARRAGDLPAAGEPLAVGDVVHGIWGHRSEAVLPVSALAGRVLPDGADPLTGVFARVGAIALNSVLQADVRLGEQVAVFGQGVIGLLATRFAVLSGAQVAAVDMVPQRLEVAAAMGAHALVRGDVQGGAGAVVRHLSGGGVDSAIELSGSDVALHEAVRSVVVEGTVVASAFYQGGTLGLRLGEEFHHNRVRLLASQISGTPVGLGSRWSQPRLVRTVMHRIATGDVDVASLVTDVVDAVDVARAFERLDAGDPATLQVVLRFDAAPGT